MAPAPLRATVANRRFLAEWVSVGLLAFALIVGLVWTNATLRLDNAIYDRLLGLAPAPPSERIVVVAIDDHSLSELGRWPWPRTYHTRLFERLGQARPALVAYDVLFVEPDREPAVDRALADALRRTPTVLPLLIERPGRDGAPQTVVLPAPLLKDAAAGTGHVDLTFDPDGTVRGAQLVSAADGQRIPHLMATARALLQGVRSAPEPAKVLIPFSGASGAYATIPFVSVLRGEAPDGFFRGKVVLVGATAGGLSDRYATPAQDVGGMAGVEIQANLLQALLNRESIRPAPRIFVVLIGVIASGLLMAGLLRLSPRGGLVLAVVLGLALIAGSASLLVLARQWAPPGAGLLALGLIVPVWSWRRLEAVSAYMVGELQRLQHDEGPLPTKEDEPRGDAVARQIALMDLAVGRLRNLNRFIDDALRGHPDPTLVLEPSGQVLFANARAQALFGVDPVGQAWDLLVAEWRPADGEQTSGLGLSDLGRSADLDAESPDHRIHRIRLVEAGGAEDAPRYLVVRLSDVSAAYRAAEERERVQQLLSHDMRSPQASILALIESGAGLSAAAARQIAGYARRTLTLADSFVHYARAQADSYDLEPTDLSDVVMDAVDELWPQARARNIELRTTGHEREHLVNGDRALLTRALINLVENALKYAPEGSVVTCGLDYGGGPGSPEIACHVADRGQGIPADQISRLWEPFYRTPQAQQRSGGSGLGLALVRAVILRHGGRIECTSTPGEGTTMTFTLPALAAG